MLTLRIIPEYNCMQNLCSPDYGPLPVKHCILALDCIVANNGKCYLMFSSSLEKSWTNWSINNGFMHTRRERPAGIQSDSAVLYVCCHSFALEMWNLAHYPQQHGLWVYAFCDMLIFMHIISRDWQWPPKPWIYYCVFSLLSLIHSSCNLCYVNLYFAAWLYREQCSGVASSSSWLLFSWSSPLFSTAAFTVWGNDATRAPLHWSLGVEDAALC